MKLIGPWGSGYTRRVGITLKLLEIPFEHLDWTGREWREAIREYSPMVKVPAFELDDGDVLVDSSAIIDHLYELVGPQKSLLPTHGLPRRDALFHSAIGMEIYAKVIQIYSELSHPTSSHMGRLQALMRQVMAGFQMIEDRNPNGGPWLLGESLSHADIMPVVAFQSAAGHPIFADINAGNFPRLAGISLRASKLPAFVETEY